MLTDERYFQGRDRDLVEARAACALPVLRKDFTVDPWQVYESRALGADCILLIAAALAGGELQKLHALAQDIGLDVLVEVHDERELQDALACGADLIGVNNRDLHRFTTDLGVSKRLRSLIPEEKIMVSESGIQDPDDVARLRGCGVDAFLVGEAFMRAADPWGALRRLFFAGAGRRLGRPFRTGAADALRPLYKLSRRGRGEVGRPEVGYAAGRVPGERPH